jgi:hypothetical protein
MSNVQRIGSARFRRNVGILGMGVVSLSNSSVTRYHRQTPALSQSVGVLRGRGVVNRPTGYDLSLLFIAIKILATTYHCGVPVQKYAKLHVRISFCQGSPPKIHMDGEGQPSRGHPNVLSVAIHLSSHPVYLKRLRPWHET